MVFLILKIISIITIIIIIITIYKTIYTLLVIKEILEHILYPPEFIFSSIFDMKIIKYPIFLMEYPMWIIIEIIEYVIIYNLTFICQLLEFIIFLPSKIVIWNIYFLMFKYIFLFSICWISWLYIKQFFN